MNYQDKTKEGLVKELQKLQQEYDSLKTSYEKDITERKQAEEKLHQTEDRFRNLFETASDSIFIVDQSTGNFIDANSAASRLYGYSNEELLHLRARDVSAESEKTMAAINGSITEVPLRLHRRKDGTIFPVEITGSYFKEGERKLHTAFIRDITKRKQAEEMLLKSDLKYRNLIEQAPDIIFIVDAEGNMLHVNQKGQKMLGYSEDELGKLKVVDTYPADDMMISRRRLKEFRAMRAGETMFFERLMRRKDGSLFPVEINVGNLEDGTAHAIIRDITERRQVEETIMDLARFPSENPDPVLRVDRNGLLLYANAASYKFLTWELQLGKKVPSILLNIIAEALKKGIGKIIDTQHNQRVILFNIVPILEADYVNLYGQDITQRKQIEEALQQEKENFRHSLDDSPLGERIATIEGNTIYANKTIMGFYGYDSLGEMQKTRLKDRYTPESYAQAQKRKQQRKHGDFNVTEYEISIVRKNREIRHLQVYRNEVLWDGARQFQVIYKDITVHKQAEEELRNSKELLEKLNQHLHEVRENERAAISREIHDELGQSLTALKLDLNMMHTYLDNNPEAVAKLQSMIELVSNTIKDVQRISSDLRPGILDELGLISAIEWYCDEFEKRTGIKCNLKLDNSDYEDSQINLTFFRVLQETLTNVIRHAKASSVSIKLHQLKKGVTMTIKDNGIGIPEEKISSTKSFGLISMRERVKQFNGTIDISSKKDYGTKLVIFIPS